MNSVRAFPAIYQIRWAPGARTVSHYRNSANVVYWKSCTMSEFDWRSADTYLKLQAARATDLAWEFFAAMMDYGRNYCSLQSDEKSNLMATFHQRCTIGARDRRAFFFVSSSVESGSSR